MITVRIFIISFLLGINYSFSAEKSYLKSHPSQVSTEQQKTLNEIRNNIFGQSSEGVVPMVRVKISKGHKEITVSGTDLKRELHVNGDLKQFGGRKSVKFNCQSFTNSNESKLTNRPLLLASINSKTGLVTVNEDKYKGTVHIISDATNTACDVVHEVSLETYLASLLSKEMNGTWELEALKAQAVAARTYALHKIKTEEVSKLAGFNTFYDLESSEKHQVGGHFFDATSKTHLATMQTRGLVLTDSKGEMAPTFFHAKCGGRTLRPDQVWSNKVDGYHSVKDPFCEGKGTKTWENNITQVQIKSFLTWAMKQGFIKGKESDFDKEIIRIAQDRFENFFVRFYIGENAHTIRKSHFRRYFGRNLFSSNHFVLVQRSSNFSVAGEGLGHGVGMCQIGALYMAKQGKDFKEILAHYYPGLVLKQKY